MNPTRTAPHFVVDAFTRERFSGNPAAVVVLDAWLDDALLQRVARENNLSETAFVVREGDGFRIRWLTPTNEVDLCGHATLAAGHVLLRVLGAELGLGGRVAFASLSGPLVVEERGDALAMDFPSRPPTRVDDASLLERLDDALGRRPLEVWQARDLVVVYDKADDVRALSPDMGRVAALADFAINPTAPGTGKDEDVDFVSRFFAPNEGVDEDPVTGSAHCSLAPLWAAKLGKDALRARQVSARGGALDVEVRGDRVTLVGHAVLVVEGKVHLP